MSDRRTMVTAIPIPQDYAFSARSEDLDWIIDTISDAYFDELHDGPRKRSEVYMMPGRQLLGLPIDDRWVVFMVRAEVV